MTEPAAPALPVPAPPAPPADTLAAMEAARATIRERIDDKDFRTKLLAQDPAAKIEWDRLHKTGFPAPPQIASVDDVNSQAAARNAEIWNSHISALKQQFPLTAEQEAEIRRGVIRADLHQWAREEKDRVIKDKAFYRRLLDGDRAAKRDWGLLTSMLALRPVKG